MSPYLASVSALSRVAATGALLVAATIAAGCSNDDNTGVTGAPATLTIAAGDATTGTVGADIGPFVVKVTDMAGTALSNVTVTFVASSGLALTTATATTNADGTAFTSGTFSHLSGAYTVTATVAGISAPIIFHTTATPDVASAFIVLAGNHQTAPAGTTLGEALTVHISDQYNNPIQGMAVVWSAPSGIVGSPATLTGADGNAHTTYTLPAQAGATAVTATTTTNTGTAMVAFTVTGT